MRVKIDNVRVALERQTQQLEETHRKLERLSGRLHHMEEQNRIRDLERLRAQAREEQRLEDERWIREWEAMCISEKLSHSKRNDCNRLDGCDEEEEGVHLGSMVPSNELDHGTQTSRQQGAGM
ncbi:hypothetical protein BGZ83_004673 [Gryganskiella cystojenkinii]|nr:hypothetical protein BGZ83_004673 [Gryganskiella cystojenkinii]